MQSANPKVLFLSLLTTGLFLVSAFAEKTVNFEIRSGFAKDTIRQFGRQTQIGLIYDPTQIEGVRTNPVNGQYAIEDALRRLFQGTVLGFNKDVESGAFAVVRLSEKSSKLLPVQSSGNLVEPPNDNPKQHNRDIMNKQKTGFFSRLGKGLLSIIVASSAASAQDVLDPSSEEDIYELSPFEISTSDSTGYSATSSLAGTRIRTDLRDVGSSISVLTPEFLEDVSASDNESVLVYALNTEVGGPRGNYSGGLPSNLREQGLFSNPNANTRVRGLSAADNTRNFYITDIPWDGYVVSRVDLQRGPNAILFGLGSPAGVINASTDEASFSDHGELKYEFDKFGSNRVSLMVNRVILDDQLAVRVAALDNRKKFRQKPAFSDDTRIYTAIKYKPEFMNNSSTFFEISGNFENGNIDSNRPRQVTPVDKISRFWDPLSQGGLDGNITIDRTTDRILLDESLDTHIPSISQFFSTGITFLPNAGIDSTWMHDSFNSFGARNEQGEIIDRINTSGPLWSNTNPAILSAYNSWARKTGQEFFEFYKEKTLSDPTVFDFFNKLPDGPNKGEYTDWNVYELNLAHTFLNNKFGYNIGFFDQRLDRGQWGLLGWNNVIHMDINETLADGSPNPDIGRAYIQEQLRNLSGNTYESDRSSLRVQVYGEYNFRENKDSWWRRLLGSHRFTGLYSEDKRLLDNRNRSLFGFTPEFLGTFTAEDRFGSAPHPAFKYYLSDNLIGRSSASGANLNNMGARILRGGGNISVNRFVPNWVAGPEVGFNDPWEDPDGIRGEDYMVQSANPANYQGYTEQNTQLISVFDQGEVLGMSYQDYLTKNARLSREEINSKVLVWQGTLWDDSIILTYGFRQDRAMTKTVIADSRLGNSNAARQDIDSANMDPAYYTLGNPDGEVFNLDTETKNWSIATHVNRLLGKRDFLPLDVSVYYNKGENFQPAAGRLDAYARPLPPPGGETEEYSVLLATKDGKYSLRATSYETISKTQNSTGSLGAMWAFEQALFFPAMGRNQYRAGNWTIESHPDPEYLENEILPAWDAFELALLDEFPDFVNAWISGPWGPSSNRTRARNPAGHVFTEDAISEGLEFEFVANPTSSWRIAINASKTEAVRDNVPGEAFQKVVEFVDYYMQETPVGDMPMWWPQSPGPNDLSYSTFRPDWIKLMSLNGQSQGEIREWRINLITNYTFKNGTLEGLSIGGAYRYEDESIIDYAPMVNEDGVTVLNLNKPYTAPSEKTLDLWFRYEKELTDKIDWKIQLNVYNAFGENDLIPMSAQPDGSVAALRIKEGSSWSITNTFSF